MSTIDDLKAAFAGESQAHSKYLAFAKKAEDEGYPQAARLFRAAAEAELIHAHNHLKAMNGIGATADNIQAAINGENFEVVSMYPPYIEDAKAEGNKRAANSFAWAWEVEKTHEGLYREMLAALQAGEDPFEYYVCPVCGHTHKRGAPEHCPVCGAAGEKFIRIA